MCGKAFAADAQATTKDATAVDDDDMILDIGPQTGEALRRDPRRAPAPSSGTARWASSSSTQFGGGTKAVAEAIAASPAFSIAGGGDTLAAIAKYGVTDRIGYISTGGGAFLEFLEGKVLPAVRDAGVARRRIGSGAPRTG